MLVKMFACPNFRERRALPALAFVIFAGLTICVLTQDPARQLAEECALKEVKVATLIEDHAATDDLSADRLANAGLTMLRARSTCYAGRVDEALAIYESILDLGPIASLLEKRP
jgi:hypothetical protein